MDTSSGGDKRHEIFISSSEQDLNLLNELIHLNWPSETSAVDVVRQRRRLELRTIFFNEYKKRHTRTHHGEPTMPLRPTPDTTRIFTLFMSQDNAAAIVGDLAEHYAIVLKHQGHRSAQLWFWRQVFQSLFPLLFAAIRRVSGFERLMEFYRRKRL
jgi:hypothetical protein